MVILYNLNIPLYHHLHTTHTYTTLQPYHCTTLPHYHCTTICIPLTHIPQTNHTYTTHYSHTTHTLITYHCLLLLFLFTLLLMSCVILVGPPGCGKGTLSKQLVQQYNMVHVSTGDILRNHKDDTLQDRMKKGEFVEDSVINNIMVDVLCNNNLYLLDGYPRNINQATVLNKDDVIVVIVLQVSDDTCNKRIQGRNDNRADDNDSSVVCKRLRIYHEETEPLIQYYDTYGKIQYVDGNGTPDDVYHSTKEVLDKLLH